MKKLTYNRLVFVLLQISKGVQEEKSGLFTHTRPIWKTVYENHNKIDDATKSPLALHRQANMVRVLLNTAFLGSPVKYWDKTNFLQVEFPISLQFSFYRSLKEAIFFIFQFTKFKHENLTCHYYSYKPY